MGLAAAGVAGLALPSIGRAAARQLRFAHNNTTTSGIHVGAEAFAKAVAELSGGKLSVEVFPNNQLGTEAQNAKAITEGSLDLALLPVGVTGAYSKECGLTELPYLFRDAATARVALDGPLGQYGTELLKAKNMVTLGWGEIGIRHFTANKPIKSPADIKGMKLRVPLSEPILQTFLAMGVQAQTLPFGQLIEALRTGQFDGQENPIGVIVANNLNKVQSHISLSGHVYTAGLITVSKDVLEELGPAEQAVLSKAGLAGVKAMRDYGDKVEVEGIAQLKSAGMTIVDDIDKKAFQDAAAAVSDKLAAAFGADSIKRIRGYAA